MAAEVAPLREGQQDDLQSRVAGEIRAIMARQRLSQVDVARRLGRPQSYVSRIYRGAGTISLHDVEVFAGALGVRPVALLMGATEAEAARTTNDAVSPGRQSRIDSLISWLMPDHRLSRGSSQVSGPAPGVSGTVTDLDAERTRRRHPGYAKPEQIHAVG